MQHGINSPIRFYKVGYCKHPNAIVTRTAKWQSKNFPIIVTLIKHPTTGYLLFDTGYSNHFYTATHPFPERFYRWITPVHYQEDDRIDKQLQRDGIKISDVKYIVISHFHADHIAGLHLFSNAQFICSEEAYKAILHSGRVTGLIKGYLPKLIPDDFNKRVQFIEEFPKIRLRKMEPFDEGCQLFNDDNYLIIPLPGHAVGHIGLFYRDINNAYFLIGDACWQIQACKNGLLPHWLAYLIKADKSSYNQTFEKLTEFYYTHPEVKIIPSHCEESYRGLNDEFSI